VDTDQRLHQLSDSVAASGGSIDWPLPGLLLPCLYRLEMPEALAQLAARLQACGSYGSCHRLSAALLLAFSWLGQRSLAAQPGCRGPMVALLEGALGRERRGARELQEQPQDSLSFGLQLCCHCDECAQLLAPARGRPACSARLATCAPGCTRRGLGPAPSIPSSPAQPRATHPPMAPPTPARPAGARPRSASSAALRMRWRRCWQRSARRDV
jgi:hypothetical protein